MAATVATADADDSDRPAPRQDSVPVVDLRLLSQSELYSLSLSSESSFDLNRSDDVVIPKINRAVFNESAGSRKQTYSHLRLASAESTTIHRRTPHLRSSLTHPYNNINDPEQAENSQIIRMLKQLCKSDPNFQDVDQIEDENNINSLLPEFLNAENLGIKRKRGRPRKHENVVFLRPPTAKRIRHNTVKKVVVYDDERDREIVNDRGVTVNTATLAGLHDPYGPEIRRRTVGMSTEDELLGFLRGMNGQWGSRRKKRRVVDASEFGDALPKGWKLSLCIKKKEGRVWLFCRRYISPSGRQFESCNEISAYLISVTSEENMDKRNHINSNPSDDISLEGTSANAADLVLPEDIKRDDPVENPQNPENPSSLSPPPSPPPPPPPESTVDEMEVQVEDPFKDALSDHHETNISQLATPLNELEKTEPSLSPPKDLDSHPVLMTESPKKETLASVSCEENVVVETYDDTHSCEKLEPPSPQGKESNTDELHHDLNVVSLSKQDENTNENCNMNEDICTTEQTPDLSVSQSELLGDEDPMSVQESNKKIETFDETHVNSVDKNSDFSLDQGINASGVAKDDVSERVLNQSNKKIETFDETHVNSADKNSDISLDQGINASDVGKDDVSERVLNQDSVTDSIQSECMLEQDGSQSGPLSLSLKEQTQSDNGVLEVSETLLQKSNQEEGFDANMDIQIDINSEKESSSGFFLGRFGLDKDGTSTNRDSVKPVNTEPETLISGTFNNVNKLSSGLTNSGLDGQFDFTSNAFDTFGPSLSSWPEEDSENKNLQNNMSPKIPSNKQNDNNLEFCSLIPSENDQEFSFQDDVTCLYDECKEESSERGLLDHFSIADTSDDIFENKMYSTPLDGLKFDEDRDINSNELSLAFGNPHDLYPDTIKKDLVVPSKIDEGFGVHTNLSMVNNSMVEELKGGRGLFNLGCNEKSGGFENRGNAVYTGRPWDGVKLEGSGNKFSTGFGSGHGQSHAEVVSGGMWKSADGNQLGNSLSNSSSHAQIPYPSSFHSFNIMSEKAGDGQFRVDERYNEGYGVNGLRSGRPEPVEFSFLTSRSQHNPHALQADSRVFPYNVEMDQQFDSSFWLGKNPMMGNTSVGRNQMTSVCGWCRNEFHIQPLHSGTQDGIGSLCPSCSAGMSGHVNML